MIDEIIALEWKMFGKVQNVGGRASCQDDWETFYIMRKSQFQCYDDATLLCYRQDLETAQEMGRNLIMEKYAYMMASTHPDEFAQIASQLPVIDLEKKALIEAVVAVEMTMTEAFYEQHPILLASARVIHTAEDSAEDTSMETYLRAELSTYSLATLLSYAKMVAALAQAGENLIEKIVRNEVYAYGYASLEAAEKQGSC